MSRYTDLLTNVQGWTHFPKYDVITTHERHMIAMIKTTVLILSLTCFFYKYEADFMRSIFRKNEKKLDRLINITFLYVGGGFTQIHSGFGNYAD